MGGDAFVTEPREGCFETLASFLFVPGLILGIILIVRVWDTPDLWKAIVATVLTTPVGLLVWSVILLPVVFLIGKLAPMENPGRLGHNLTALGTLIPIAWIVIMLIDTF